MTPQKQDAISEIIVTAQKRSERLEDVPAAVTVVDAASMLQRQEFSLQDYYTSVPGLSISTGGPNGGRVNITMRGLSTGGLNPTVGITIDDVPIGATDTAISGPAFSFVPQLDPADLQRIEFLKGPQGTLYGASSLGGVMRYVTAVPDLTSISGHVDMDGSAIPGGGNGYAVRGSLNTPVIADTLAIRVSAFDRRDPGFVDDPKQGRDNVNSADIYGGRVDTLLQATQNITLRLSALIQRAKGSDNTVDTNYLYQPISGAFDQSRLKGAGVNDFETQLYSANLDFHLNGFDVTSLTAYGLNRSDNDLDIAFFNPIAEAIFGVQGAKDLSFHHSTKFSQEVRLSSTTGSKFEWLVGGFYTAENSDPTLETYYAVDPVTGATVGELLSVTYPSKYQEYAGFANLTYHFTDHFNVQVGGRESHNMQKYHEDDSGLLFGPIDHVIDTQSRDSAFTYLVTPQLHLSDSVMIYATVASGYQPGGPNAIALGIPVPNTFGPDRTVNYELGLKSRLFDRRLSIDTAVFYIVWSKIQLQGFDPATHSAYNFNGGDARSKGVEIATEFRPVEDLSISTTAAYTDAKLTNTVGNGFPGVAGDPLPWSSKFSASLAADKRFSITRSVSGFIGASAAYVGKRYEGFPAGTGQTEPSVPSYAYANLRAGIVKDGYTVTALIKNVTNERGILSSGQESGNTPTTGIYRTVITTPRTIGLSVSKTF